MVRAGPPPPLRTSTGDPRVFLARHNRRLPAEPPLTPAAPRRSSPFDRPAALAGDLNTKSFTSASAVSGGGVGDGVCSLATLLVLVRFWPLATCSGRGRRVTTTTTNVEMK